MNQATARDTAGHRSRLPGEPGVWLFIFLDLLIFSFIFYIFTFYRARDLALFDASQQALNPVIGLVYTVLLLGSSWCVAMAVKLARGGTAIETARRLITWAFCLGAAFAVLKFVEYTMKAQAGIYPITNNFYMFYFCLTIIHLVHVLFGLCLLRFMRNKMRALPSSADPRDLALIESGASFWHMVDLVWIVLFALLYLRS